MNKPKILTKDAFFDIEECECGKHVFKYHDTSKNSFFMKCANSKYELDIKTKKWIIAKKHPCNLYNVYHGERPTFITLKKIKNQIITLETPDFEKRLSLLFDFLFISTHYSTLQEVDTIVKNNLKREPRKTFYYPSIGHLRISHRETFKEYRDRIFSEKIVDRALPLVKIKLPINLNNFVDVPDELSESDAESQNSKEDSDSDKEDSDYSEFEETEPECEEIIDLEEECDDYCDYDGCGGNDSD